MLLNTDCNPFTTSTMAPTPATVKTTEAIIRYGTFNINIIATVSNSVTPFITPKIDGYCQKRK